MVLVAAVAGSACFTVKTVEDDDGSGGSGGGSGGSDSCGLYDDETGSEITLRVKNDTIAPIYIPTSCGLLLPEIELAASDDGNNYGVVDRSCLGTCEVLRDSGQFACAGACALITHRVMPGATLDVIWGGTGLEQTEMPLSCFVDAGSGPACLREVEAPAAEFSVSLTAYDECSGDCACEGDECFGEASGNMALSDAVTFVYPSDTLVEVVFGGCAFGCP